MQPHFPDNVLNALKEAVVNVFWTKKHLREVISRCDVPQQLVNAQDWNGYKFHIIDPILNSLNTIEHGLGPLRRILAETLEYKDGEHLLWLQDGQKRKREAERALDHLRLLVEKHDQTLKAEQAEQSRRRAQAEEAHSGQAFRQRLATLKERFLQFHGATDPQKRGYDLQTLLYDLFVLFDLEPRSAFALRGEQIDGAFVLDADDYLLEAKWQKEASTLNDLRDLDGAIASNLDNTLGLFVSINGFSQDALQRYREGSRPRLICLDGADLMLVLEGQIDLPDLLRRKRSLAAQRGEVFVAARRILLGEA
ncbi:MAG: restriction endonuclease [Pirellulales bacterium]|nr:restriction endonuclease [Pirellulales bacterium]